MHSSYILLLSSPIILDTSISSKSSSIVQMGSEIIMIIGLSVMRGAAWPNYDTP